MPQISCHICSNSITPQCIPKHIRNRHSHVALEVINQGTLGANWVVCELCGLYCKGRIGLRQHIRLSHPAGAVIPVPIPIILDMIPLPFIPLAVAAEMEAVPYAVAPDVEFVPLPILPVIAADDHGNDNALAAVAQLAPVINAAVPVVEISFGDLVSKFRRGLYSMHPSWKTPFQNILRVVLAQTVDIEEEKATKAIAALQLIPGLLEYCRSSRGEVLKPIDFLRCVDACPDKVSEIIRWARLWSLTLRQRAVSEWARSNAEKIRSRIELLMDQGRLNSASAMTSVLDNLLDGREPPPPMAAELLAELVAELHPPSDERDLLPDRTLDPLDCIQISAEILRNRIYLLKRDSSAGNTGWTNRALRFLLEDRDTVAYQQGITPPNDLHLLFTELNNKILRGEILGEARDLLVTARLQMIPKADGGHRPIRIECAIVRLFGAAACGAARIMLGERLRPLQLGGGFKSGTDMLARLMDIAFAQQDAIIKVDISNAFNTIRHRAIFNRILEIIPCTARFFRWKYGSDSCMRNNSGEIIAHTCTGVGQGDPWGAMFFELGFHPALESLQALLQSIELNYTLERNVPIVRPGSVTAYEDDTMIRGEAAVMFILAPLIAPLFAQHGIYVKTIKSRIAGVNTDIIADQPENFLIEPEGMITVGIPIGTADYRMDRVRDMLLSMAPPTRAIRLLRPKTAYQLIKMCFNAKPAYLLRSIYDLAAIAPLVADFDRAIAEAIATIFQLTLNEHIICRFYLPLNLGGLGLTRHLGMNTEKNQVLSRVSFISFLTLHHPREVAFTQEIYTLKAIFLGTCEGLANDTEITEEERLGMTPITGRNILSKGKAKAYIRVQDVLIAELAQNDLTRHQSAWLLSTGGGHFLHGLCWLVSGEILRG
jgi:hypothetical protein